MWSDQLLHIDGNNVALRHAGPTTTATPDRPVLVLHDAGADTVDALAWERLAERRDVWQVLLPGVGDSSEVPAGADVSWITSLLASTITDLVTLPITVVGTSLGGWFAMELALAHPAVVNDLVLLDSAGLQRPRGYLFGLFADGQGQGGHDGLIGPLTTRHRAPRSMAGIAPYIADLTAAALQSWNPHVHDPSLIARLPALNIPTAILWGADDALIPVSHGRALASAIPKATFHVIQRAGHLLAVDAPDDVVRRLTT